MINKKIYPRISKSSSSISLLLRPLSEDAGDEAFDLGMDFPPGEVPRRLETPAGLTLSEVKLLDEDCFAETDDEAVVQSVGLLSQISKRGRGVTRNRSESFVHTESKSASVLQKKQTAIEGSIELNDILPGF